jgi:signal transduction histidine kinase
MTELPEAPQAAADGGAAPASLDTTGTSPDAEEPEPDADAGIPGADARMTVGNGLRESPGTEPGGPAGTGPAGTGPTGTGPAGTGPERMRAVAARFSGGWPLRRIIGAGVLIAGLFSVLAIIIGAAALTGLDSARGQVVDTLDPAAYHASQLEVALLNQETGVRGYVLTAHGPFLQPYWAGITQQAHQVAKLRPLLSGMPAAQADLTKVLGNVTKWRANYAEPTITQVRTHGKTPVASSAIYQGKVYFDDLRVTLNALQGEIASERTQAVSSLNHSASVLDAAAVGFAVILLVVVIVFAFGLWRSAILPLSRLAADARQVAGGDFEHRLDSPGGPLEVRAVGQDVDQMRERILAELSAVRAANATLEARTADLQRSNAELEQFAYVASHDLQEPLRKVASFCQLLQRRYAGRLDAKADEYIEHAVDGAKRMQALINDLLAFSRVGRTAQQREPVSCSLLLAQAWANLAPEVRGTHATLEQGELPVVLGEASLLTATFQNLLSNALKFRGDQPPRISVSARRDGQYWLFSFSDNGIGIDPQYADRIFVIFQRLHDRATYSGTGIGLAMVKKIIEYHGGRIWLDETATSGARFCFTLPMLPEDKVADD